VLGLDPDKETDAVPTYQYSCTACGSALEAQQAFSDEPLTVCPECDGRLRKVFSAVGVVFKGSGFYRNDSRASQNGGDGAKSTTSGDADSSSSTKTTGDSGSGGSGGSNSSSSSSGSDGSAGSASKEAAKAGSAT
jgi:putative FmdB family regulatory protein